MNKHQKILDELASRRTTILKRGSATIRALRNAGPRQDGLKEGGVEETHLTALLSSEDARELARISQAVAAIKNGTYGSCFKCGGDISALRLQAMPFATECRDCKDAAERRQFAPGSRTFQPARI